MSAFSRQEPFKSLAQRTPQPLRVILSQELEEPDWDAFVEASPLGHYEQTSKWARAKAIYGWRPIRLKLTREEVPVAGAQVLVKRLPASVGIGYLTKGPVFDSSELTVLPTLMGELKRLARSYKVHYLMLQLPDEAQKLDEVLRRWGFREDPVPDVVSATTRIDLTRDLEEIFSNISKNNRRFIRYGERRGVRVRPGDRSDIPCFFEMMLQTCKRQGVAPNPPDCGFLDCRSRPAYGA